ncbi:MAG TPA: DUF882 domain-containing protein [Polyangiaceae bacterium]|nr:DUF882 domain-containing protein [Polyangiaceae bacterium]
MRTRYVGGLAVALGPVALAASATASAQPPAHGGKHGAPSASHAPTVSPNSGAAAAYLSGKQAMVGWHAPSTREAERDASGRPMLVLTTLNRGETLAIPSSTDDGTFCAVDLDRVAHLLRAATGDEHPVDPRTLATVYGIQVHFGVPEIRVVSGYRVPRPGSRSNHGKGRAVDLVVPGVADEEVARYARELGFVGVGVYPTSQFVHVDVRPRSYFWVDFSGPHMKNRERGILGDLAAKSDAAALARGRMPIEPYAVATDVDAALRARGMAVASAQAEEDEDED